MQRTYVVRGKRYRFTEQYRGYIRLDIDCVLQPSKDFNSWKEVEEYIRGLKGTMK